MAQIHIDEITESKSGKSWRVRAGHNWYGAGKDMLSLSDKGKTFQVDIEASDFGPWIKSAIDLKHTSSADNREIKPDPRQPGPQAIPTGGVNWLPFASNVVAHCIAAGLIKEPDQIKAWVFAAKNAAEGAAGGDVGF